MEKKVSPNWESEGRVRDKLDYPTNLLRQMDRIGFLLTQVDAEEAPQPRIRSFGWAVGFFIASLRSYGDKQFEEDLSKAKEEYVKEKKGETELSGVDFKLHMSQYQAGMDLMARRGLLLKEGRTDEM